MKVSGGHIINQRLIARRAREVTVRINAGRVEIDAITKLIAYNPMLHVPTSPKGFEPEA